MTDAPLVIMVDWPWALGIIGVLIAIAFKAGGRLTGVEKDISWLRERITELKSTMREFSIKLSNTKNEYFSSMSPINLTTEGDTILHESGLKNYIDTRKQKLLMECGSKKQTNPYEVQQFVFDLFDSISFEPQFDDHLKKFAFDHGLEISVLRRIGAIYFRNICLEEFGMNPADIDNHSPSEVTSENRK